jgi:hypothetical protein
VEERVEAFVRSDMASRERPGTVSMLTPENFRACIARFIRSQWATDEQKLEAGLKHVTEEELFAIDGRDPSTRKVRWEVRHFRFTLPERGIVSSIPEGLFVKGTLETVWNEQMETLRMGQPQAQWVLVAATVEDQEIPRREAVPVNYTAGGTASAAMAILQGNGAAVEVDPSRRIIELLDHNVVVSAMLVDLTRGDLVDPNLGIDERVRTTNAMQAYVDSGRAFRSMPMGMRRERDRARATLRRYLQLVEARVEEDQRELKSALAAVDPAFVAACRAAGMADADIATNLRVPLQALVAAFPHPKK